MPTRIHPVAFQALIETLIQNEAEFELIGGVALILQGSSRSTQDLDICYARNDPNYERIAAALGPWRVRLRDAPENLPFRLDAATLRRGLKWRGHFFCFAVPVPGRGGKNMAQKIQLAPDGT